MIEFRKPDIQSLVSEGYICVDMHFHTIYSDGASRVSEVIDKSKKLGIGVSICDHNEIGAYSRLSDIFFIPGIEIKSKELVDILFYFNDVRSLKKFYNTEIRHHKTKFLHITKTDLSLAELLELSQKYDCLAVVAHPFGYSFRSSVKAVYKKHIEILQEFSAIEVINGGTSRKDNVRASDILDSRSFTGGSDGHSIYCLGKVVTCAKAKTAREFLDKIRKKKNKVIGKEVKLGKIGEGGYFAINKVKGMFR